MLVEIAGSLGEDVDEKYLDLLSHLPPYLYDENGALKEWAAKSFEENNEHRHLSHLYCAWPIDEVQNNEELKEGCIRALSLRTSENAVSHALVQRALIAERLKDSKTAAEALETLLKSDIMYSSLMTNHDLDRNSCYCTDFALGYLGIINEALVYSDNGTVELLPALSAFGIDSGSVKGLRLRSRAAVDEMTWDRGGVTVTITSDIEQNLSVSFAYTGEEQIVYFKKGETKTVNFEFAQLH